LDLILEGVEFVEKSNSLTLLSVGRKERLGAKEREIDEVSLTRMRVGEGRKSRETNLAR